MLCRNHVDVSEGVRPCARCGGAFCRDCLVMIGGQPYCAVCKTEQLLDARSGVARGVGNLATIGRRFLGYLIDTVVMYVVNAFIGFFIGFAMARGGVAGALLVVTSAAGILTTVIYEALLTARNGQTVGKMVLTIRVVSEDGAPVTAGQAWGRAFAKIIPFAAFVALFNDERKGIHDMLARTRVVNIA